MKPQHSPFRVEELPRSGAWPSAPCWVGFDHLRDEVQEAVRLDQLVAFRAAWKSPRNSTLPSQTNTRKVELHLWLATGEKLDLAITENHYGEFLRRLGAPPPWVTCIKCERQFKNEVGLRAHYARGPAECRAAFYGREEAAT